MPMMTNPFNFNVPILVVRVRKLRVPIQTSQVQYYSSFQNHFLLTVMVVKGIKILLGSKIFLYSSFSYGSSWGDQKELSPPYIKIK